MNGTQIMTQMIQLLVGGIVEMAKGIGAGLSEIANSIFLQTVEGVVSLSTFGAMILIFAGISLAIGLTRWGLQFFTSLGARNK